MTDDLSRRRFLAVSAAAGLSLAAVGRARADEPKFKTSLKKACIVGRPNEAALKAAKDAGFDGVESTDCAVPAGEAVACREAAEKLGMRIHSVLRGWMEFNSKDPATVAKSIAATEQALRAAQGYGADAILLVPCKIGGMPMPEAWDFKLEFDPQNGHLKQVVDGDHEKYKAYIEAHDWATDSSREAVKKLIPVAQETKVVIALENVWNSLWVKPEITRWLVASFESPWVKAYLDLGNHVKYAPTEEWIKALGPLLAKCHAKDFKLNANGHGGSFAALRQGSNNWPSIRKALDEAGYNGWLTVEGPGTAKDLDAIIAGT
jgi:L-ribulose-5-phosphate 3-epimerase